MTIYFYSSHEEPYGCFSNFSRHGIEMDGIWWPTVEHYFQAQKFAGTPYVEQIQRALTPKHAAEMGRNRKLPLRPDWEQVKDEVMFKALVRKFETHKRLRTLLLSTKDEEIVESAPGDYYWGCGADGKGAITKLTLVFLLSCVLLIITEAYICLNKCIREIYTFSNSDFLCISLRSIKLTSIVIFDMP